MIRKILQPLILAIALLFIIQPSIAKADVNCPKVKPEEITQLFSRWNAAVETGRVNEVIKNYAQDAILLPTLSNKVRRNQAEIADYFSQFLRLKPKGEIDERNVRIFCDVAIDSGIYSFAVDGKTAKIKARFTFVYKKTGNDWLIVEHHSSLMPEKF